MRNGGILASIRSWEADAVTPCHFAFTTSADVIEAAADKLRDLGVDVTGPVTHDWMPARSIYFSDPDGHELELCAPLPGAG